MLLPVPRREVTCLALHFLTEAWNFICNVPGRLQPHLMRAMLGDVIQKNHTNHCNANILQTPLHSCSAVTLPLAASHYTHSSSVPLTKKKSAGKAPRCNRCHCNAEEQKLALGDTIQFACSTQLLKFLHHPANAVHHCTHSDVASKFQKAHERS